MSISLSNWNTSATSFAERLVIRPALALVLAASLTACKRQEPAQISPETATAAASAQVPDQTPTAPAGQPATEIAPPVVATPPPAPEPPPAPPEPPAPPFPRGGRRFVVGEANDLPLPVICRRGQLDVYERLLKGQDVLPSSTELRFEQLLNAFDLRPHGVAVVAKGATVMAETLACPWKPSSTLLLVRFENGTDAPHDLTATLHFEPTAVSRYRLLGTSDEAAADAPLPASLPAKSGTTLLIEMELRAPAPKFGQIRWSVDGSPAPPLNLDRAPAAEPSDDARFASLLGAFSLWLAKDQPEILDGPVVAGLARECVAEDLSVDRKQALILIAKALEKESPEAANEEPGVRR